MLKLKKIAITGAPCSGKTLVCQLFQEYGAYVVNADEIAHQLLSFNKEYKEKVVQSLGQEVLEENQISRDKIANIVFKDPEKLKTLEKILHPYIFQKISNEYQKCSKFAKAPLFVVEVPLLFEAGWQSFFDIVILVKADMEIRKKRFDERKSMQFFYARDNRFSEELAKEKDADFILYNNGSIEDLREKFKQILQDILNN